jgi:hypothetical protein
MLRRQADSLRNETSSNEQCVRTTPIPFLACPGTAGRKASLDPWLRLCISLQPGVHRHLSGARIPEPGEISGLEQVCLQIKAWDLLTDARPHVALNVSGRQCYRSDFAKELQRVVEKTEVAAQRLTVEITESTLMVESGDNIPRLAELKELGVGLSEDDFGTGHSSLSYLTRFPIDELKIDRTFIKGLPQAKDSTQLAACPPLRPVRE